MPAGSCLISGNILLHTGASASSILRVFLFRRHGGYIIETVVIIPLDFYPAHLLFPSLFPLMDKKKSVTVLVGKKIIFLLAGPYLGGKGNELRIV